MARVGGGAGAWPFGARRDAPAGAARLLAAVARLLESEQERWFLWLPVLFGVGIAVYFALPIEPLTLVALMPAVAALALHLAGPRSGLGGLVTAALLAITLGLAAAKLRTELVRAPVFQGQAQSRMQGLARSLDVYGHVELVEPRAGKGQRVTIRVIALEKHEVQAWPLRVRIVTRAENAALKPGDAVRLRATLNPPPGPSLPGDYDFARAAWFLGLGAVGSADGAAEVDADAPPPRSPCGSPQPSPAYASPSARASSRRCPARPVPSPTRSSPASAAASPRPPTRHSATPACSTSCPSPGCIW